MKYLFPILLTIIFSSSVIPQSSLDTKLQEIKTKYQVVGMSVSVVKGDSIVFSKGYGLRDIGRSLPVNDSTVYRIASISKMITAAALMILYEQGLFNLDDDVSTYLGFTLRNPYFPTDVITFRKILSHTSSLRDGTGYDSFLSATYNNNPPPSLQSLLTPSGSYYTSDMFSSSKRPSANYFEYSNINFGVVGTLVEKISKKRFDIFCKEKIFQPLNISGSFNIQDIPNINNVAVLYRKSGGSWVPQTDNYGGVKPPARDLSSYVIGSNGVIFAPQGGLRISARDLSKFMLMIMNNGILNGVRILNDTIVTRMLKPEWIYNGSNGNNYYGIFNTYAFGNHRTSDLLPTETLFGHPGEAYGLISDMYFSQLKDYGIIFITNGGVWGYGIYSGWYNIEEDVYKACLNQLDSLAVGVNDLNYEIKDFVVYQNYPNPFGEAIHSDNPSTTIKFSTPKSAFITLKVYDILGREVGTFVNEEKQPGIHEIKLNELKLSNGVYFYKLTAGDYFSIKKMSYLK
ncbi:MAG: serine hydrolase [Ignavibacteria bacterium]|nr:serine hydrolase [Ignavibacteria bacterium]